MPSNADQFDQNAPTGICGPINDCLIQFQQAAARSKIFEEFQEAMKNSGTAIGMPKFSKEQFNEFCGLMDTLLKCFDEIHAAQCKEDPYYKIINGVARMCQPPHLQGFLREENFL